MGKPVEILSLIRAKELAQAELALARYKIKEEQKKAKAVAEKEKAKAKMPEEGMYSDDRKGAGSVADLTPSPKKKHKVQKKKVPLRKRYATRQARGNGQVS
jgi:hypothetical protein